MGKLQKSQNIREMESGRSGNTCFHKDNLSGIRPRRSKTRAFRRPWRLCYRTGLKARHTSLTQPSQARTPIPLWQSFEGQRERLGPALEILRKGIAERAFPGATFAVVHRGQLVGLDSEGRFTYEPKSSPVQPQTVWDLASLTKVIATTTMAMWLYERGQLQLDVPIVDLAGEFDTADPRRRHVTTRMLLTHTSGLPGYERLFERARTSDEFIQAAFALPLVADPGTKTEYSDIGFIIIGVLLERLAGESLDRFCQREIFQPLGMAKATFNPPRDWRTAIPPSNDDHDFRHRIIQGEVQDENAWVMGGVAGHAGLFGNAYDVALFAHCVLQGGAPVLRRETVDTFSRRQAGTTRALGWDTPTPPSQSGHYFSPRSIGHLGYAGTSLWIDPARELAVVLLTNRTWPDRGSQKIKTVRPSFHDAIVRCLGIDGLGGGS